MNITSSAPWLSLTFIFLLLFGLVGSKSVSAHNSLDFDGTNDIVTVAGLAAPPAAFTVEWYIYPHSLADSNQVIVFGNGWGSFKFLTTSTGAVFIGTNLVSRMTDTDLPAGTVVAGEWQKFAFSHDGTTGKFYKDGELLATKTMPGSSTFSTISLSELSGGKIHGKMDEFRYWNKVLPQCEIISNLTRTLTGSESNLILGYNFNIGTAGGTNTLSTTLLDIGASFNGALANFALSGATSNWVNSEITITGNWGVADIDLQGNSTSITSGDMTPTSGDFTDFGSSAVGETYSQSFAVDNVGTAEVYLISAPFVTISGTHAAEFSVSTQPPSPIAPSVSSGFVVDFTPVGLGTRSAILTITSGDCSEGTYTFAIQGSGTVPISTSLDFDGTDDYVDIPDDNSLDFGTNSVTLEAWIYPTNLTGTKTILDKKVTGTSGDGFSLSLATSKPQLVMKGALSSETTYTALSDVSINTWTHIAVVIDQSGSEVLFYINGVLDQTVTISGITGSIDNAQGLGLGKKIGASTDYFEGKLDEIRLWDVARTPVQIQSLLNREIDDPENEVNLAAYYQFDQTAGIGTLPDLSSNTNTGTLTLMDPGTDWGSSGIFTTWTGLGNDGVWTNSDNWSNDIPGVNSPNIQLTGGGVSTTIPSSLTVNNLVIESTFSTSLGSNDINVTGNAFGFGSETGTGAVVLNGGGDHSISGTFNNLELNEGVGSINVVGALSVTGSLALTSGKLNLGDLDFILGSGASIVGGTSANYIQTSGTGRLCQTVAAGATLFPIGNASYNPISMTNTGTSDAFKIRVIDEVLADGTTGSVVAQDVVDRTWDIEESIVGGSNVSITLQWESGHEMPNFNRPECYISHYTGSTWDADNTRLPTGSGPFTLTRTNITEFSPFAVSSNGELPVEWLSFTVEQDGGVAELAWSTASEINSESYQVERSMDGTFFTPIGKVKAVGNSQFTENYGFDDTQLFSLNLSTIYYRLNQLDVGGSSNYSNTIALHISDPEFEKLSIFPNPTSGTINLTFFSPSEHPVNIKVLNNLGQEVYHYKISAQELNSNVVIDSKNWPPGIYHATAIKNKVSHTVTILIEK